METKQTAVKWLVTELNQEINYIPITQWDRIRDLVQRAKAMEREQHGDTWDAAIKAYHERGFNAVRAIVDFDEYWKEKKQ